MKTVFSNLFSLTSSVPIRVIRYGGCGTTKEWKEEGGFLDNLPSRSEYITGTTGYVLFNDYDDVSVTLKRNFLVFSELF